MCAYDPTGLGSDLESAKSPGSKALIGGLLRILCEQRVATDLVVSKAEAEIEEFAELFAPWIDPRVTLTLAELLPQVSMLVDTKRNKDLGGPAVESSTTTNQESIIDPTADGDAFVVTDTLDPNAIIHPLGGDSLDDRQVQAHIRALSMAAEHYGQSFRIQLNGVPLFVGPGYSLDQLTVGYEIMYDRR